MLNRYHPLINMQDATVDMANQMKLRAQQPNNLKHFVENNLSRRRGVWKELQNGPIQFPILDLDDLRHLTFGLTRSYIQDNVDPQGISSFIISTTSIQINYIKVPTAVKNNTKNPVILDCNYSVRPDDTELTVKWLFNEELIYQWIPPQKPQSLGIFKDRLDLSYKATDDPQTEYRTIKIKPPIMADISGEYKCWVSTFADEDFGAKSMVVFEPERRFILTKTTYKNYINFTCMVSDVYPAPRLHLYKDSKNDILKRKRLSAVEWDTKKNLKNGRYTMFLVASEPIADFSPGTLVHCELKIPGTGYVRTKSVLYYPEYMYRMGGSCSSLYFRYIPYKHFSVEILVLVLIIIIK